MKFIVEVQGRTFDVELDQGNLKLDGETLEYSFAALKDGSVSLILNNKSYSLTITRPEAETLIHLADHVFQPRVLDEKAILLQKLGVNSGTDVENFELRAPMPGLVLSVIVSEGDQVEKGDGLVVVEAMKMENELRATGSGTVAEIHVSHGTPISKGQLLITFRA